VPPGACVWIIFFTPKTYIHEIPKDKNTRHCNKIIRVHSQFLLILCPCLSSLPRYQMLFWNCTPFIDVTLPFMSFGEVIMALLNLDVLKIESQEGKKFFTHYFITKMTLKLQTLFNILDKINFRWFPRVTHFRFHIRLFQILLLV